jgi:LysR family glycine cleavage system transcriptional activator
MNGCAAGGLEVVAPPSFASRWLVPRLHRFYAGHPEIELHLSSALRAIDGASGRAGLAEDMRGELPQLWIRFGKGRYPGFHSEKLFCPLYVAVCSPRLVQAEHGLRQPADLRHHALIHDDTILERRDRPRWADWLKAAGVGGIDGDGGLHFTDPALAIAAAIDGLGVALVPRPMVSTELADGRLVTPFDIGILTSASYHMVTLPGVAALPAVAAFTAWLRQEAEADPAASLEAPEGGRETGRAARALAPRRAPD